MEDVSGVKNRELYSQRRRTSLIYDFQIRCILGLVPNRSFKLYDDLARDTATVVFKIGGSLKKKIRRSSTLRGI